MPIPGFAVVLIDLAFGTFENPEFFELDTGFYPGASRRLLAMLAGADVSRPPASPEAESQEQLAA